MRIWRNTLTTAIQQQIDFAIRDGIISPVKHQHILSNPFAIAREYNINPFFLFKKSTDILPPAHIEYVRSIRTLQREVQGAYFISEDSLTQHFQMMVAILIRNQIEAWYYSANDLVQFLDLDYENKFVFTNKIVFISHLNVLSEEAHTLLRQKFIMFLNFAMDNGVFLHFHFTSKTAIVDTVGEYWYKLITGTFHKVECGVA